MHEKVQTVIDVPSRAKEKVTYRRVEARRTDCYPEVRVREHSHERQQSPARQARRSDYLNKTNT